MAAEDEFLGAVERFSAREQELLKDLVRQTQEDLLAARSEEARVRIAETFIAEAHDRLQSSKR